MYSPGKSYNTSVGGPALQYKNGPNCTSKTQNPPDGEACSYEDDLFESRVHRIVQNHANLSKPLFVFWASHIVHGPLQVPDAQLAKFSHFVDK